MEVDSDDEDDNEGDEHLDNDVQTKDQGSAELQESVPPSAPADESADVPPEPRQEQSVDDHGESIEPVSPSSGATQEQIGAGNKLREGTGLRMAPQRMFMDEVSPAHDRPRPVGSR